jgi:hypothetical protein
VPIGSQLRDQSGLVSHPLLRLLYVLAGLL